MFTKRGLHTGWQRPVKETKEKLAVRRHVHRSRSKGHTKARVNRARSELAPEKMLGETPPVESFSSLDEEGEEIRRNKPRTRRKKCKAKLGVSGFEAALLLL